MHTFFQIKYIGDAIVLEKKDISESLKYYQHLKENSIFYMVSDLIGH